MKICALLLIAAAATTIARAQSSPNDIGIRPGATYDADAIGAVNLLSGNLSVNITLASIPQIGKLSLPLTLVYNSQVYQEVYDWNPMYGTLDDIVIAIPPYDLSSQNSDQSYLPFESIPASVIPIFGTSISVDGAYDGSIFSVSVQDETGAGHLTAYMGSGHPAPDVYTTANRAFDGSGLFVTTYSSNSSGWQPLGGWTVMESNGVSTTQSSAAISPPNDFPFLVTNTTRDANGNQIIGTQTINPGMSRTTWTVQDSIGRTFSSADQQAANTSGCVGPLPVDHAWTENFAGYGLVKFCYANVSIISNFTITPDDASFFGPYPPVFSQPNEIRSLLQSVILPNHQAWTFEYNDRDIGDPANINYGSLTKIILPSGGTISYQYATGTSVSYNRSVIKKTIDAEDGLGAQTWSYTLDGQNTQIVDVTDPMLNQTRHTFSNICTQYLPAVSTCQLETQTDVYNGAVSPANRLKTVQMCYSADCTGATLDVPFKVTTTYDDGTQIYVTNDYTGDEFMGLLNGWYYTGRYSNAASVKLYQSGISTPLSETDVSFRYQTDLNYLNANILDAVSSITTLYNGQQAAYTSYGYDENNGSPQGTFGNQTSVSSWLNTSSNPVKTSAVYNAKGMPSQTIDAKGSSTYFTYDSTGFNIASIQYPNTDVSHVEYFHYDPTSLQLLWHTDQNGTAPSGTTPDPSHTTFYTYDATGRLTDVLSPPATSGATVGAETKYCYTDLGGSTCPVSGQPYQVYSTTSAAPDPLITTVQQYDGFGRPSKSIVLSDPEGPLQTDTVYDFAGRVHSKSNPYRSLQDPTYGTTVFRYDALGRPLSATHQPDGSAKTWNYSGLTTTASDELQTASTSSTTDILGRLVSVVEPGSLTTTYGYDGLGNLTAVNQLGNGSTDTPRIRTFTYDSLSRLLCSSNPETSTASCPAAPTTSYIAGTTGYSYDLNGNALTKTYQSGSPQAPTTVTLRYSYDALNRLLGIVSNDPALTPSNCYQYDTSSVALPNANLIGKLTQEWTQSQGTCPSAPPTGGGGVITRTSVLAYDAVGNALASQQCVLTMCAPGGTPFQFTQKYNMAGQLSSTAQNYFGSPAGQISLYSTYDGAGRLRNLESSVQDSTHPAQIFGVQSYVPTGMQDWTLGNFLNGHQTYDSRGRITGQIVTHP